MAYADAFAIAAAQELDATVITNDPEFQAVENLVSVEWLSSSIAGDGSSDDDDNGGVNA